MAKSRFSLAYKDPKLDALMENMSHKTLATWSVDCALRVLPYFEASYPEDARPRIAIQTCCAWIETGVFRMADIRKASLDAHAAARAVGEDNAARSAARAAGQAVATAHVATHALAAANYALQAIHRAAAVGEAGAAEAEAGDAHTAVAAERVWQYARLLALGEQ